jgi:hypothetical protein
MPANFNKRGKSIKKQRIRNMTLVELNQIELNYIIHVLRWHIQKIEEKQPLPKAIEKNPKEIQSLIYRLEEYLE